MRKLYPNYEVTGMTKTESRRASRIIKELTPPVKKFSRTDLIKRLAKGTN